MENVIYEIGQKRRKFLKLVLSSIVLASAVGFIVNYLCDPREEKLWQLIIGCSLMAVALLVYFFFSLANRKKVFRFEPIFIIDKNKKLVNIHQYDISWDMQSALEDAFVENSGIKNLWDNYKFSSPNEKKSESTLLLEEVVEYCVLQRISMYTTSFFEEGNRKNYFQYYDENELSSLVLNNKFVKQFSEPMKNRSAFNSKDRPGKTSVNDDNVVACYTPDARFERFDFWLPKDATIKKTQGGPVVFDFKYFKLTLSVSFRGFSAFTALGFDHYYLGFDRGSDDEKTYQVDVSVSVKEKVKALFVPIRSKEYGWIDGLLNELNEYLSFPHFLKRINWDSLSAQLFMEKVKSQRSNVIDVSTSEDE